MKTMILTLLVLLNVQAYAAETVYTKSVEITMDGVPEGTVQTSTVIIDNEFISVEMTNADGFGCYFEGKNDTKNDYITINASTDEGKSCSISTNFSKDGKILSISSMGNCSREHCGAGAELKVSGFVKVD